MGSPNSILIKLASRHYRALVDTGAEVSVISERVYNSLKPKPQLENKNANLQTADGSPLSTEGLVRLQLKTGSYSTFHDFFVAKNLNRNCILGRDWLTQNGVRMYFDLGALK